ncbi:hypothetical protein FRC17_009249 [Serendipita sp. 399]|nr:hypothetical protein FRC17_009249 [Serendipita sp. 399]
MDEIDPNEKKNRRPVGRERDELIRWATRDREELTRISDEMIANFDRISDSTAAISDYEETLRVLRALRTGTEAKITANIAAYQIVQLYSSTTPPEESNDPPPTTNRGALALREALKLQQDILDDNYKELNRLKVILINVEARIEQMEDEIEATRSILAFIRSRNTTLATQKTAIERDWLKKMDLLSARRQIPEEIWREVFIFRVLDDERQYQLSGYKGTPPFTALKLSGVCQYWRRIALEQQELWAFIAIRNDHRARTEPRIKYYLWRLDDRPPNVYTYY